MEGDFTTFFTNVKGLGIFGSAIRLVGYKWYRDDSGAAQWGETDRHLLLTTPVTGTGATCPPQVSCSVTEKTAYPKHWGRFYLPGIAVGALNTDGSLTASNVSLLNGNVDALYDSWSSRGVTPIVLGSIAEGSSLANIVPPAGWVGEELLKLVGDNQVGTGRIAVGFPVTATQVDDVLDVQRRRRWESVVSRSVIPR